MPRYELTVVMIEISSHSKLTEEIHTIDGDIPDFGFLRLESPTNCFMVAAVCEAKINVWLLKQGKRAMVTDVRRIS